MSPLSKLWGKWLLTGQYVNVALLMLSAFIGATGTGAETLPLLATWKTYAIQIHGSITVTFATLQAMAKALPDADGDGRPDLFDPTPNGES